MAKKPNVILITSDQQRVDSLGCYGAGYASTPAADALAKDGVLFRRAYCTNPVCAPSRASIFTGNYIDRHGVFNCGINFEDDPSLLTHRLKRLGYATRHIGKSHFNVWNKDDMVSKETARWYGGSALEGYPDGYVFGGPFYGFDTVEMAQGHTSFGISGHYGIWARARLAELGIKKVEITPMTEPEFGGRAHRWNVPPELSNSAWTALRAASFIDEAKASAPFFLNIGFQDPHHPHILHADKAETLRPEAIPPPCYAEGELDDKPPFFKLAMEGRLRGSEYEGRFVIAGQIPDTDNRLIEESHARLGRAYYYGMAEQLDYALGQIIGALKRNGLYDDSLIIFTTDHGELLGDHGIWMKGPFLYEQLINVPLIVKFPKNEFKGVTDELASLVDLLPTVMNAAGQTGDLGVDGTDLAPLASGEVSKLHDFVTVHHVDDPDKIRVKSVITKTHKLTYHYGRTYGELYDLIRDPGELKNLWDDPSAARAKAELLSMLVGHAERVERRLERVCYV